MSAKKKQSSPIAIILITVFILLGGGALYAYLNEGINISVNSPSPIVITQRADNANSTLLKEKETIYATIRNEGGSGNVLVTFHLSQGGYDYERSKLIYLGQNQEMDLKETFDEVRRLGGQINFSVEANAE